MTDVIDVIPFSSTGRSWTSSDRVLKLGFVSLSTGFVKSLTGSSAISLISFCSGAGLDSSSASRSLVKIGGIVLTGVG